MRVTTKEFIGALRAARMFACEDETRSNIHCIHLEAVGSALRLVATDGHTLWCCEIPALDDANDPAPAHQAPWNVSLFDADMLVKILKARADDETDLVLAKRTVNGMTYPQQTTMFSPYENVIQSIDVTVPGKVPPEFAAGYIARACDAFRVYGKGLAPEVPKVGTKHEREAARTVRDAFCDPPVAWRVGGPLDPAFVYSPKFPAAFAIVMPRKGDMSTALSIEDFVERVRTKRHARAA